MRAWLDGEFDGFTEKFVAVDENGIVDRGNNPTELMKRCEDKGISYKQIFIKYIGWDPQY